jgi:hypothetical protein
MGGRARYEGIAAAQVRLRTKVAEALFH